MNRFLCLHQDTVYLCEFDDLHLKVVASALMYETVKGRKFETKDGLELVKSPVTHSTKWIHGAYLQAPTEALFEISLQEKLKALNAIPDAYRDISDALLVKENPSYSGGKYEITIAQVADFLSHWGYYDRHVIEVLSILSKVLNGESKESIISELIKPLSDKPKTEGHEYFAEQTEKHFNNLYSYVLMCLDWVKKNQ